MGSGEGELLLAISKTACCFMGRCEGTIWPKKDLITALSGGASIHLAVRPLCKNPWKARLWLEWRGVNGTWRMEILVTGIKSRQTPLANHLWQMEIC